MQKILLFSAEMTNRLHYAATIFFSETMGFEFDWTDDLAEFKAFDFVKINYSDLPICPKEYWLPPHSLLFENAIKIQEIELNTWQDLPIFFENKFANAHFSFDFLAASFYLITRYEEYLTFEADKFGRFTAANSLAFRGDFLEKPLINLWAIEINNILKINFPTIKVAKNQYFFLLTYDIDYAWAYLNKSLIRNVGGFLKEIGRFQFKKAVERCAVLIKKTDDPFDTFDYQKKMHAQFSQSPIYFFHVGDYSGEPDAPINFEDKNFRNLVQNLAQNHPIGVHPSWKSHLKWEIQKEEIERLSSMIVRKINRSRQHFLRINFPETYQILRKNGLENDYSLGYSDAIGFRASIAQSFLWFDLSSNLTTDLRIHPFQIMDVTLNHYLQLSPDEAINQSVKMIENIKKIGGHFTLLWHNNSLSERENWVGWRRVFEAILAAAR